MGSHIGGGGVTSANIQKLPRKTLVLVFDLGPLRPPHSLLTRDIPTLEHTLSDVNPGRVASVATPAFSGALWAGCTSSVLLLCAGCERLGAPPGALGTARGRNHACRAPKSSGPPRPETQRAYSFSCAFLTFLLFTTDCKVSGNPKKRGTKNGVQRAPWRGATTGSPVDYRRARWGQLRRRARRRRQGRPWARLP